MGWALDGRLFVASVRRALGGSSQWPDTRRTLERPLAEPCLERISLDGVRRARRCRGRSGLAAQGRRLHQAQLPRPWLDHGSTFEMRSKAAAENPLAAHLLRALALS